MNKKYVYIGLAVLAVAGLGIYLYKKKEKALTSPSTPSATPSTTPSVKPPVKPSTKKTVEEQKSNFKNGDVVDGECYYQKTASFGKCAGNK